MGKRSTDSGLPRGQRRDDTLEGVPHVHGDPDAPHLHRLGNVPHDHDDEGRPVFKGPGIDEFGMVDGQYHPAPDLDPNVYPDRPDPAPLPTDKPHIPDDCWCGWAHTLVESVRLNGGHPAGDVPPLAGPEADPPATPSTTALSAHTPSDTGHGLAETESAGSGGGSGRPFSEMNVAKAMGEAFVDHLQRRSIGRVVANTAMDTALGVPPNVLDERAHGREATELLMEAAADHWRHNRPMPAERLLDLEAVVQHMVESRGLK